MSIGARNQSAKTYLESHFTEFTEADLDHLILHGIRALRETLPQNKQLEQASVTVAYVGPGADADPHSSSLREGQKFTVLEGDKLATWFERLGPSERQRAAAAAAEASAAAATANASSSADNAAASTDNASSASAPDQNTQASSDNTDNQPRPMDEN